MSGAIISDDTPDRPPELPVKRAPWRRVAKALSWAFGAVLACLVVLYLILLVTPIRLPFTGETARNLARSVLPPSMSLEMGDLSLAVEGGVWPVIQFSPVVLTDSQTGARIAMEALEVGFSPLSALIGQPGATITIVAPHIQMVQDLYGPRMASMELVESPEGGPPTLRVLEGEQAFPTPGIFDTGVALGAENIPLRSDNDWLIYNLESAEVALSDLVQQAVQGRFSRLTVRDGTIDMSDSVYGLYRRFDEVELSVRSRASDQQTSGTFSARIGGRTVSGTLERLVNDDGTVRLRTDLINLDFSALLPFIDSADSLASIRGAGALSMDLGFEEAAGKLSDGIFRIDVTGVDLRIGTDYFPMASSILEVTWDPASARFDLAEGALQVGQSSTRIGGRFVLGLDPSYGPTMGMNLHLSDLALHPNDMEAPAEPFETLEFSGWSAPLYGALGVDRIVARKGEAIVEAAGRVDMLLSGLGFNMTIAGKGVSADDMKRLWPYITGTDSRDWFVANVPEGRVVEARMAFNFPVGSFAVGGEDRPIPDNAMQIDILGRDVAVRATETMAPIAIDGMTRLQVDDTNVTISATGGQIETEAGPIIVSNPALVMDNSEPGNSIMEVSGDIRATFGGLLELATDQMPDALAGAELPIDLNDLSGAIDLGLVATIALGDEDAGRPMDIDYVLNGTIRDFASAEPIQGRTIGNGQLSFSASQDGYQLGGIADIDGMQAEVSVEGTATTAPSFRLATDVDVADLAAMGFDASQYLTGRVRLEAQPLPDNALQVSIDLANAALTIRDLGLTKASGTPGTLSAIVRMNGELTHLENIALTFGDINLAGRLDYHATDGLVSANFDTFALSAGDSAQVALAPRDGGYSVTIRGRQLDLKPMLGRFFSLGEGSGGVQSSQFTQTIALDVELDRAIGYYATTAFNLDFSLLLRGSDMRSATMSAQFSEGNAISITTNPAPRGRTLSVAFNDAGTVLRFVGVYSQLAGGTGSLVLTTDSDVDAEGGQLLMRNFAIVDEENVRQILGNHSDSRAAIAASNRLDFNAAQVDFMRRSDRVEVMNAMLTGPTVGGTLRGFIYTDRRQYDLTGTYVPLFGLNNAFQQIPILGPLLGGRDGEGLLGVTFAVNGPLSNPQFTINPLSVLLPGAFRELFEFRARELPPAE